MRDATVVVRRIRRVGRDTAIGIPKKWAGGAFAGAPYVRMRLDGKQIVVEPLLDEEGDPT